MAACKHDLKCRARIKLMVGHKSEALDIVTVRGGEKRKKKRKKSCRTVAFTVTYWANEYTWLSPGVQLIVLQHINETSAW